MSSLDSKDLQAILDINSKINTIQDVKTILYEISNYAAQLSDAEGASILLVDPATGNLHFEVAFSPNAEALMEMVIPKGKGIAGMVAETGKYIIVNDAQKDTRFYNAVDEHTNLVTRNLVAVPLMRHDQAIGVLEIINSHKPVGFSEDDVELLMHFAYQAAISISNALLYKDIQDKADELDYLYQISMKTNNTLDRRTLFDQIVKLIAQAAQSSRVSIMFINEESGQLEIQAAIGIPAEILPEIENALRNDKISSQVASSGELMYSNNISQAGLGRNKKLRYSSSAFISVPVKVKNIPVGVINISEPREGVRYSPSMIKMLQTVANQVGAAFESNKSYLSKIEHEKLQKELEILQMLQNALLISNFKDYQHLSIFARMKPAKIVGGDFYDLFELGPNRLGFVVGDVSGKGLPASLFMAISRSVIKAYSYYIDDPAELLNYANKIVVEDSRVGMFVTMFYGVIDTETGIVSYSNAGHNLQYIYRPRTDEFIPLNSPGIPLGIEKEERFATSSFQMEPGDYLFTFTDGILEAVNSRGEEFGLPQIQKVVREYASTNAQTFVNSIVRSVDEWADGVAQWDDMTVLAFKLA